MTQTRKPLILSITVLILAQLFISLIWLGKAPFATRGEPREALVAQAMIVQNEYILPRSYDNQVPSKPPLLHWFIVFSSKLFGELDEFAARFPSWFAATLVSILFFITQEKRLGLKQAVFATIILLSSVEWARATVASRVDMIHSAASAAAMLFWFKWFERSSIVPLLGVGVMAGLACLSKGPVGIVIPAAVFILYGFLEGGSRKKVFFSVIFSSIIAIAIASFWYVLAYKNGGQQFLDKISSENLQRFTSTMEDAPHSHSVFYLLGVFLIGFLPWTFFLIPLLKRIPRTKGDVKRLLKSLEPLERYALIVCVVTFVFYAIPSSKRSVYLLVLYPHVSLLAARGMISLENSRWVVSIGRVLGTLLVILCSLILSLTTFSKSLSLSLSFDKWQTLPVVAEALNEVLHTSFWILFVILLFSIWSLFQRKFTLLFMVLPLLLVFVVNAWLLPAANSLIGTKFITGKLTSLISPRDKIASLGEEFYGVSFYLQRRFESLSFEELREEHERLSEQRVIITRRKNFEERLKPLVEASTMKVLGDVHVPGTDPKEDILIFRTKDNV